MKVKDIQSTSDLHKFIQEESLRLKAFCDTNNVSISPYQILPEWIIKSNFDYYLKNDVNLKAMCIDDGIDTTDPVILQSLYEGFKVGAILDDFSNFVEHTVKEIKALRKHTKKGFKHFEFRRVTPLKGVHYHE